MGAPQPASQPAHDDKWFEAVGGKGVFHEEHEVPRGKLVTELKHQSDLFSTQQIPTGKIFSDTPVPL